MDTHSNSLEHFLLLSAVLTGFDQTELLGTGLANEYYQQVVTVIGDEISQELWTISESLPGRSYTDLESAIRDELMDDAKFGPIARNIIQLWYWGAWIELPREWLDHYKKGTSIQDNDTRFTSSVAYQEGLIWKVMGTHPQGAKNPGFGSWSMLPGSERATKEYKG